MTGLTENIEIPLATHFCINRRVFMVCHDEIVDWKKYSKAWHRSHGPYKKTENRRLIEATSKNAWEIVAHIPAYRKGWLDRALQAAGITQADITAQVAAHRLGLIHPPEMGVTQ